MPKTSQHMIAHRHCQQPFDWWTSVCLSLTEPFYQRPCYLLQISIFLGVGGLSMGDPNIHGCPWLQQSRVVFQGLVISCTHVSLFSHHYAESLRTHVWETIQNAMMSETGAFREASGLKDLGKELGPLKSQRRTNRWGLAIGIPWDHKEGRVQNPGGSWHLPHKPSFRKSW